jgi:hypothetical protein
MPGLDPGFHPSSPKFFEWMDCRVTPGNDESLLPLGGAMLYGVFAVRSAGEISTPKRSHQITTLGKPLRSTPAGMA